MLRICNILVFFGLVASRPVSGMSAAEITSRRALVSGFLADNPNVLRNADNERWMYKLMNSNSLIPPDSTLSDESDSELVVMSDSVGTAACASGWKRYSGNGMCYKESTTSLGWYASEDWCWSQRAGAHLASIHSKAEAVWVDSTFKVWYSPLDDWIGLRRDCDNVTYIWTDGTAVDFLWWQPGYPKSAYAEQSCVTIWDTAFLKLVSGYTAGQFDDMKECSESGSYALCKYDPNTSIVGTKYTGQVCTTTTSTTSTTTTTTTSTTTTTTPTTTTTTPTTTTTVTTTTPTTTPTTTTTTPTTTTTTPTTTSTTPTTTTTTTETTTTETTTTPTTTTTTPTTTTETTTTPTTTTTEPTTTTTVTTTTPTTTTTTATTTPITTTEATTTTTPTTTTTTESTTTTVTTTTTTPTTTTTEDTTTSPTTTTTEAPTTTPTTTTTTPTTTTTETTTTTTPTTTTTTEATTTTPTTTTTTETTTTTTTTTPTTTATTPTTTTTTPTTTTTTSTTPTTTTTEQTTPTTVTTTTYKTTTETSNSDCSSKCDALWIRYNGACYGIVKGTSNYYTALKGCALFGGEMATITDANMNDFMRKAFSSNNDSTIENQAWIKTSTYTNWATGKPNEAQGSGYKYCTAMALSVVNSGAEWGFERGVWTDYPCNKTMEYAICKQVSTT